MYTIGKDIRDCNWSLEGSVCDSGTIYANGLKPVYSKQTNKTMEKDYPVLKTKSSENQDKSTYSKYVSPFHISPSLCDEGSTILACKIRVPILHKTVWACLG